MSFCKVYYIAILLHHADPPPLNNSLLSISMGSDIKTATWYVDLYYNILTYYSTYLEIYTLLLLFFTVESYSP